MGGRVKTERIEYLDGLRGIAIVSVLLFHAYVAFPDRLPFGNSFELLPIRLGWQGVQLFFLISGFVILMSLEKCTTMSSFLARRWFRLFPAMLTASLIILSFEHLLGAGPDAPKTWINLIPGLTFINPALIHSLTGLSIASMDGSFWSLYVEVIFYVTFGAVYFVAGRWFAICVLIALFVFAIVSRLFFGLDANNLPSRIASAADWIGFVHFGWFASGALFYVFSTDRKMPVLALAICLGTLSALTARFAVTEKIGLLVVVALFASVVCFPMLQKVCSNAPLLNFGFISYPLYLLHYPIIKVLLIDAARYAPWLPPIFLPVAPLALVSIASWWIAKFGEPRVRYVLKTGAALADWRKSDTSYPSHPRI